MQKIMFSTRYGLEQATIAGNKTMTRRIIPIDLYNQTDWKAFAEGDFEVVVDGEGYYHDIRNCGKYRVGEEVAIAQSYRTLSESGYLEPGLDYACESSAGYNNKMFVLAKLMPHRIRFTNIRAERMQDISNEDCIKEGIGKYRILNDKHLYFGFPDNKYDNRVYAFPSPRQAFAELIKRTCGSKAWCDNPWTFVYEYKLVK